MKKTSLLSLALATTLFGAGYQIPNNSINSVALSTANVANANGADAAYFNPANMTKNKAEANQMEVSLTYVGLTPVNYQSTSGTTDIDSKKITSMIPALHFASANLANSRDSDVRLGLSLVVPAGLARAWDDMPANATSKKYALQTIELNPSIGVKVNDKLSFGIGVRYVKGSGEVELDGSWLGDRAYTLKMKGDGDGLGMNFALAYQPSSALNLSATYRSEVHMTLSGEADVNMPALVGFGTTAAQSSNVALNIPIPANAILAAAYTFESGTTVEVTFDRTLWSVIQNTNFDFSNPYLQQTPLEQPSKKEWRDSDSYRLGLTQKYSHATVMAAVAYNKNPAPDQYVSFSSPETDTLSMSLGGRYAMTDGVELGLAGLYNKGYDRRTSQPTNPLGVNGKLSNKDAYVITAGATFKF